MGANNLCFGIITYLSFPILYFITINLITGKDNIVKILKIIVTIGFLVSVYAILQFLGVQISGFKESVIERSFSSLGNPISLGGYLATILPIYFYFLLNNKNKKFTALYVFFTFTVLFALFSTYSRGAIISTLAGILIFLFLVKFKKIPYFIIPLILSFLFFILSEKILLVKKQNFNLTSRVITITNKKDPSIKARVSTYKSSLNIIKKYPLGIGPGNFTYLFPKYREIGHLKALGRDVTTATETHNFFLTIATSFGFAGLLSFLFFLFCFFYKNLTILKQKLKDEETLFFVLITSLISFLIQAQFNLPEISTYSLFFILMALVDNLISKNKFENKTKPTKLYFRSVYFYSIVFILFFTSFCSVKNLWADFYFGQGYSEEVNGNFTEAIIFYKKALYFNNSNDFYHFHLAKIEEKIAYISSDKSQKIKLLKKAINEYKTSLLLNNFFSYNYALAKIQGENYQVLGKKYLTKSINIYKKLLFECPLQPKVYVALGILYIKTHHNEKAIKVVQEGLKIDPTYKTLHQINDYLLNSTKN